MPQQAALSRGWFGQLATAIFIALSALAAYEMRYTPAAPGWSENFNKIVDAMHYPEKPDLTIRSQYTGITSLDYGLQFLVAAFLPGAAGFFPEMQLLQAYFLLSFFAIISIYSVEAGRIGAKGSWIY